MSDRSSWAVRPALVALLAAAALLCGCGQMGKLYLPEAAGEIVTRPTQTPPAEPGDTANSPQSVDSPAAPATPAPEVTEPEGAKQDKKDGAKTPPPAPAPKN